MRFRRAISVALLGLALGACDLNVDPSTATLNIGDVAMFPGLRVSVTSVVVGGADREPWFQVWLRLKNTSEGDAVVPDVAIVCHGSDAGGHPADTQDRHYPLEAGHRIPAGSSKSGVMRLLPPGAARCALPALVRMTAKSKVIDVRIPDAVVRGLNDY